MLQDYYRAQPTRMAPQNPPIISSMSWVAPPNPLLKINYDDVVFKETKEAGIGVVIKNSAGQVIASLIEKVLMP